MRLTLRHLEVFLAIAHHQNVTQAAASLALSQSAASTALKEFEKRFAISLFDRVGKRLQLNELGLLVRPRAEALLAQATEFEQRLTRHTELGNLRVGATLTIGNYVAVSIIARYIGLHPESRIELIVENTRTIASKVRNFELDVGLIEGELQDAELEILPWRDDELTLFCAPDHEYADRKVLTDEDLLAAQWIVRETGSGTRQAFDRAMSGLLPEIRLLLELQQSEGIKRAVAAGLGVGCLSRLTLDEAFRKGSLIPLEAPQRNWRRKFYFILHRQKFRSASIERWLELCGEQR
jgi:DNA-binding transcriptional LysR family regulator